MLQQPPLQVKDVGFGYNFATDGQLLFKGAEIGISGDTRLVLLGENGMVSAPNTSGCCSGLRIDFFLVVLFLCCVLPLLTLSLRIVAIFGRLDLLPPPPKLMVGVVLWRTMV